MRTITLIDTTFRDGQQSPVLFDTEKYRFDLDDKKQLLTALLALGVRHFEFFSPVVGSAEAQDYQVLRQMIRGSHPDAQFFIHTRCHDTDISLALEAGCDGLHLYLGMSEVARMHNHHMDLAECIVHATRTLSGLVSRHPTLYLRFSAEDAFRTPLSDLYTIYDAVAPYVQTFGLPDTVGIAEPEDVTRVVLALRERYPQHEFECHFHNDRGLALANVNAAIRSGVRYIDTSIWGMAERSGIPSTTAVLFNTDHIDHTLVSIYQLDLCYPVNVLMGSILRTQVPWTEPVSLTNRTHTAGVHQKAVLKEKSVYEGHHLERYGVATHQLLLGPLSGSGLIYYYLREVENYIVSPEEAREITCVFKSQTDQIGRDTSPADVLNKIARMYPLMKRQTPLVSAVARYENLSP